MTKVSEAELDLEMAVEGEDQEHLHDTKASKTWRALRQGSKTKLSLFDKVEDGKNLQVFLEIPDESNIEGGEMTANIKGEEG